MKAEDTGKVGWLIHVVVRVLRHFRFLGMDRNWIQISAGKVILFCYVTCSYHRRSTSCMSEAGSWTEGYLHDGWDEARIAALVVCA